MTITIERIDDVKLPYDEEAIRSGDPSRLDDYFRELLHVFQDTLDNMIQATNLVIDTTTGKGLYSKTKSADGQYPLGTWRLRQVDDNWRREYLSDRDADTWTDSGEFERAV